MSSTLQPVLTSGQSQSLSSQINKTMHPQQGTPATYVQPSNHMAGGLVNLPHGNTTAAHSHTPATHQANHYSLNVPNASQHYMSGNSQAIPASNHPVPNVPPSQQSTQMYSTAKNVYSGGYAANLGHSHPPNQSTIPPVIQALPATNCQPPSSQHPETHNEKPQSNGTPEVQQHKSESKENHVTTPKEISAAPTAQSQSTAQTAEKQPTQPTAHEKKIEPTKASEERAVDIPVKPSEGFSTSEQTVPTSKATSPTPSATPVSIAAVPLTQNSSPSSRNASVKLDSSNKPGTLETKSEILSTTLSPTKTDSFATKKEITGKTEGDTDKIKGHVSKHDKIKEDLTALRAANVDLKSKETVNRSTAKPILPVSRTQLRKTKPLKSEVEHLKTPKPTMFTQKTSLPAKTKRNRIPTQPYQSPLPELEIISKLSVSSSTRRLKGNDDKLIVFYKNEFLAVRNSEGGFYICQALQNIKKSSGKIRIRWLSQDKSDKSSSELYAPDFYDNTDFDCILTNLNLEKVAKGKFKLPLAEQERTASILKRSLAAEKGEEIQSPSVTEEHPDGLDLSLYKEESQLLKRKGRKRKSSILLMSEDSPKTTIKKSKTSTKANKSKTPNKIEVVKKIPEKEEVKKLSTSTLTSRNDRSTRNNSRNSKVSPKPDAKKAKVLAKVVRNTAAPSSKISVFAKNARVKKPNTPPAPEAKSPKLASITLPLATKKSKRSTRK